MEMNYLFIDGACLREALQDYSEKYFNGDPIELDYPRLGREFQKIF